MKSLSTVSMYCYCTVVAQDLKSKSESLRAGSHLLDIRRSLDVGDLRNLKHTMVLPCCMVSRS